jgi:hypothetical protein
MRYGKPIKNKKHRDPRYFLHEDIEGLGPEGAPESGIKEYWEYIRKLSNYKEQICTWKVVVIAVINSGYAASAFENLGEKQEEVTDLINKILTAVGLSDLNALQKNETVKKGLVGAVNAMCMF